jgi:hypothetical protein
MSSHFGIFLSSRNVLEFLDIGITSVGNLEIVSFVSLGYKKEGISVEKLLLYLPDSDL